MRLPLEVKRNSDDRGFDILEKKSQNVIMGGIYGSVEIEGEMVSSDDAASSEVREETLKDGRTSYVFELTFPDHGFIWRWEIVKNDSTVEVTALIHNARDKPITVGKWSPIRVSSNRGGVLTGGDPGNLRFFRWRMWDMRVELLSSEDGRHDSENICHLHDAESGLTLLCGFITIDRMLCGHSIRFSEEAGIESYETTCDFGDFLVPANGELAAERLCISLFTNPYEALEEWAEMVSNQYEPVFEKKPPVGWCGGGWIDAYSDREECWEKVALDNARAIREKLRGFDVRYIWTSQYNLKSGMPGNWSTVDEEQIPSGLRDFFEAMMDMGYIPGLWVAPFWFFSEAEGVLEENRENLLRDKQGIPICEVACWEFNKNSELDEGPGLHKYFLDGTHPKTEAFIRNIFTYYRDIGVRYYMLDFLRVRDNGQLHDMTQTPLESARSILEIIRESAGKDTHLQSAVASTPGYIGIINAARVGRDFGEGRPLFPPFAAWNNATYPLHDLHFGNLHYFLQNVAASYFIHRKIYMNDYNLLTIDKPVPENHARIAATVFGLGGSPLMLGDDYRRIDPARLRMIKMCLPRTEKVPTPVDLFDEPHPEGYCHMLKLFVETGWDSYLLLAVFSTDDEPYTKDVEFESLGLDPEVSYRIFEFWNQEYVGTYRHRFKCTVPATDCRLYRIAPARDRPWLLSTDMHIQQGAVEIRSLDWDEESMKLTGTVSRPRGESGNLFFLMPRRFQLINHEDTWLVKEVLDMNVIIRKEIHLATDNENFDLHFEPLVTKYVSRPGWLPFSTEEEWLDYIKETHGSDDPRVID